MNLFNQLLVVANQRKLFDDALAKRKAEFEETITREIEESKRLAIEEARLREEVALILEKNNEDSVMVEDKIISRQIRKTLKVEDPTVLLASISAHMNELKSLGVNIPDIQNQFKHEVVIGDKRAVMDVITAYENVEGKLLDGVIEQKTQFLTIKNNQ